jgi:alkanesulfonate monooxygenase SsuD/methylene tetrahydromethanopterin reductase-like flavin-dependent oxidoreductase (luciferase family)
MITPSLGILDFGYINTPDLYAHQVINSIFEEIAVYENAGYKRFWLSEHYSPEFAWFDPQMILPLLAGYSENIRVGMAGVLLKFHSPLTVVQNFKLISAIFNGRIDLGLAGATVSPNAAILLNGMEDIPDTKQTIYHEKLRLLNELLRNDKWTSEKPTGILVPPHGTTLPQMWTLGSTNRSASIAMKYQYNFCISFMHPGSSFIKYTDAIKVFKDEYYSMHGEEAVGAALVACACCDNKEEQQRFTAQYFLEDPIVNTFGTAEHIAENLHKLHAILGNDEFILFSPEWKREKRVESYIKIAEQFMS